MIKKIFFFLIILLLNSNLQANSEYKIIASVNGMGITNIDIKNEIKLINVLNKKKPDTKYNQIALKNLIEDKIKIQEIQKNNLDLDKSKIDFYYTTLLKNLELNKNEIDIELKLLIKEKIKIDNLWNELISKKYGWKLNINIDEINNKLSNIKKEKNDLEIKKTKEKLIEIEKNKKLNVFSKYHLNKTLKQSLIKYYE